VEAMMLEEMEGIEEGVIVGVELIKDERSEDDQGMVASIEQALPKVIDALNETEKKYDMKVYVRKTKAAVVSPDEGRMVNITIEGQAVEQIDILISWSNYDREWNIY
jgi:hypothetical protein